MLSVGAGAHLNPKLARVVLDAQDGGGVGGVRLALAPTRQVVAAEPALALLFFWVFGIGGEAVSGVAEKT